MNKFNPVVTPAEFILTDLEPVSPGTWVSLCVPTVTRAQQTLTALTHPLLLIPFRPFLRVICLFPTEASGKKLPGLWARAGVW